MKAESLVAHQEPLLVNVKRRKMAWFEHITRRNHRVRHQRNIWLDNVKKKWTSITVPEFLMTTVDRPLWGGVQYGFCIRISLRLQK